MAMVFQSYALWPHMNVADNVGYPLKVRGISGSDYRDRVMEALRTVRLGDYASVARPICPAASDSAWRWRAVSSHRPTWCCSTSHSPIWTGI